MKYDKKNGDVAFREEDHAYFNIKNPEFKYTSVTTLIGKYKEEFDSYFFSRYKTLERMGDEKIFNSVKPILLAKKLIDDQTLGLFGIDPEAFEIEVSRILLEWKLKNKEACDIGTAYHLEKENQWYSQAQILVKQKIELEGDFKCIKNDFSLQREKAVMPEYLIYYSCPEKILHLAGQVDLLIKNENDIYILDFKTNADGLEKKAFFDRKTKSTKKMMYPLNNIEDTKMNHYTIQLSLYAWMIQKLNPEFNVKLLKILHIDREGKETDYVVDYLKEDVERLLKYHKKILKTEENRNLNKSLIK